MRVKILEPVILQGPEGGAAYNPGVIVDVDDEIGKSWIDSVPPHAEETDELTDAEKAEAAAAEADGTADDDDAQGAGDEAQGGDTAADQASNQDEAQAGATGAQGTDGQPAGQDAASDAQAGAASE